MLVSNLYFPCYGVIGQEHHKADILANFSMWVWTDCRYGAIKNTTCAEVLHKVPTLDAADAAVFMTAFEAFVGTNPEAPVIAAAAKLMTPAFESF
jgi:hypothetical protein